MQKLTTRFLSKLNSDYFKEIEHNFSVNWYNISIILMDIPGSTCESIGVRAGMAVRKLSGVSID